MLKKVLSYLSLLLFAVHTSVSAAPDAAEAVSHQLEQMSETLKLSDDQKARIKPLLESRQTKTRELLESYGIKPGADREKRPELSFREKRSLGKSMKQQRKAFNDQLEGILDDTQMEKFEALQKERREQMRQRLKDRH